MVRYRPAISLILMLTLLIRIIVGVKYCFRYNRNRRPLTNENGEPIDLNNLPRPRRKREKKLMSMDEVNERFPLTKYKIWRSSREQDGLPAAGGITAPPSRAQSIRESTDLKRISTEPTSPVVSADLKTTKDKREDTRRDSGLDGANERGSHGDAPRPSTQERTPQIRIQEPQHGEGAPLEQTDTAATADDDDDPIRSAGVPAEYAHAPGDTCAICIDTLEDEDEVRGLTCGHAFHAGCLDPWLISRRACCPLCKADFYVPKPRPEDANDAGGRSGDLPQPPEPTHSRRVIVAGTSYLVNYHSRYGFPSLTLEVQPRRTSATRQATEQSDGNVPNSQSRLDRVRSHLPTPRIPFRRTQRSDTNDAVASASSTTPGQLEAGTR